MSVELSLKAAPFHLNHEDIAWMRNTRDALSTEAKVRQLLCIFQLATISNRRVNLEAWPRVVFTVLWVRIKITLGLPRV